MVYREKDWLALDVDGRERILAVPGVREIGRFKGCGDEVFVLELKP